MLSTLFNPNLPLQLKLFFLVALMLGVVISLPFHEYAHALTAHWMGDDTAKYQGRLTLNPFVHLSLWGTLMLLVAGVGFAKPVPVNPYNFKNAKRGMALTSLAGPVSNLLLAFVFMILWKVLVYTNAYGGLVLLVDYLVTINVGLAVFNMLPVPPLDGSRILTLFLPEKYYFKIMQYEQYIMMGLFVLLIAGVFDRPLAVVNGFLTSILSFLTGFVDLLFGSAFMSLMI